MLALVHTPVTSISSPPRKSYCKARRRPAYLRTKTGCLTCRKRKKKCDESFSTCLNCAKQNIVCVWKFHQSSRPQPKQHHGGPQIGQPERQDWRASTIPSNGVSESHSQPATPVATDEARVCPKTPAVSYKLLPSAIPTTAARLVLGQRYFVNFGHSPALTPGSAPLFDFLRSRFLPQLIRPAANCGVIDLFSRESLAMAIKVPACMHALLACCGAEIPTTRASFQNLARFHYTQAVAALRNNLDQQGLANNWLVTIHTVLMLCIYERSKPRGPASVGVHLKGAAQLINLASRNCQARSSIPEMERVMYRLVHEAFIFHVATSLPFQCHSAYAPDIDSAFALAENYLDQYFHVPLPSHPDSPVLGVAPQLFRFSHTIYRIYHNRLNDRPNTEVCLKLEKELAWWDGCTTAALSHASNELQGGQHDCKRGAHASWHRVIKKNHTAVVGPRLYLIGCRILLQRMVNGHHKKADPIMDELLKEGMSAIKGLQPALDYFAEYYCWPFYVLGTHLVEPSERDCLLAQIQAFWRATNNGTMKRLSEILRLVWTSSPASNITF